MGLFLKRQLKSAEETAACRNFPSIYINTTYLFYIEKVVKSNGCAERICSNPAED